MSNGIAGKALSLAGKLFAQSPLSVSERASFRASAFGAGVGRIGGNRFAVLGDSITQQNSDYASANPAASTQTQFRSDGYMSWAVPLSGQQMQYDPQNNYGVGGDTLFPSTDTNGPHPGINTRVASVIASGVGNCVVLAGHNDITTAQSPYVDALGSAYSTFLQRLVQIINPLLAAGIDVYLGTLVPVRTLSTSKNSRLLAVNAWIRAYAARTPGVTLVDWFPYINDYTAAAPQAKPTWNRNGDTLHPGPKQAYVMGYALAKAFAGRGGQINQPFIAGSQQDAYNASEGLQGALNANSAMLGTGGIINASANGATNATISGVVANSYTLQKSGGSSTLTATASIESPRTDMDGLSNGVRQVIQFSTTQSGGGQERLQLNTPAITLASGAYAPGDTVVLEANVELINPINVYNPTLNLTETMPTGLQQFGRALVYPGNSANTANALMENVPRTYKLAMRTPPIVLRAGSRDIVGQFELSFHPSLTTDGASATVKVGDFAIRKVAV